MKVINVVDVIVKGSTGDLVLYANWNFKYYIITYNLDGGINNSSNPHKYHSQQEIIFTAPSKLGYSFINWTDDSNNEVTKIELGTTSDITINANWQVVNYSIVYDSKGGSSNPTNPTTYTIEDEILNFGESEKDGYIFKGWYLDENTKFEEIKKGTIGQIEVFSLWELEVYQITYNLDNGTNNQNNPATYTIETETFSLQSPSKEGYEFVAWKDLNDQVVTEITMGSFNDITLTAQWQLVSFVITYELNGVTNDINNPGTYTYLDEVIFNEPTKNGYTFTNWTNEADEVITKIPENSVGNIKVIANWEIIEYTIFYNLSDGINHPTNPTKYNVNDVVTLEAPLKAGYTFDNWTDENDVIIILISKGTTGDITLTANYTIINYSITYVLNGGTNNSSNPATYTVIDQITLLDPTYLGYNFLGWTQMFDTNFNVIEIGTIGNITISANWEIIDYTIIYVLDDGINHVNNPSTYTVISEDITLLKATKGDLYFGGWYNEANDEVLVISKGSTGNIVLTALWLNKFEVTINYGMSSEVLLVSADELLPSFNTPEFTNYTLTNLYYDPYLTQTFYVNNDLVTKNMTLYAKWESTTDTAVHFAEHLITIFGNETLSTDVFKLYNDLDLINLTHTYATQFNGTLEGNNKTLVLDGVLIKLNMGTVKGFKIVNDSQVVVEFEDIVSTLFGFVAASNKGTISNIDIEIDVLFKNRFNDDKSAFVYLGLIAGENKSPGLIEHINVHDSSINFEESFTNTYVRYTNTSLGFISGNNTRNIQAIKVSNSSIKAASYLLANIGGISGLNTGNIYDVDVNAIIEAFGPKKSSYVGGIVGDNSLS